MSLVKPKPMTTRVRCVACDWRGLLAEADMPVDALATCPECRQLVVDAGGQYPDYWSQPSEAKQV